MKVVGIDNPQCACGQQESKLQHILLLAWQLSNYSSFLDTFAAGCQINQTHSNSQAQGYFLPAD